MRASPILTAFNAGEFSATLEGRSDLAKYPQAQKLRENFLLLPQGPAQRRGGTRFVKPIKNEAFKTWLIRFEFNATQAFVLEFGDLYVRFYFQHGQVQTSGVAAYSGATQYSIGDLVTSGGITYYCILATIANAPPNALYWYALPGTIYEIPSPYPLAGLTNADGSCALQFVQSGDVVYMAHQSRALSPYTLTRFGQTKWVFAQYAPNQGPFLSENSTTTTLQASASTGVVNITASAATFAITDIGRLIRMQVQNLNVKPWEAGKAYALNDLARNDGKTYKAVGAATSGTAPPVHEQGSAYDGQTGVQWAYQDAGYGIARIGGYSSPTLVAATVISDPINGYNQLPADVVSTATKRWRLGAWSNTTEFPASVTFFKGRLHWGGRLTFAASVPNDFSNMTADFFGQITIDAAIYEPVQSQDVNDILWMEGLDKLIIGTGGGEFVVGPQQTNDAYGPGNISIDKQSKQRSRAVQPAVVGTSLVYTQRAGRKLLSADYELQYDKFVSTDLAVLAERITRTGIIAIAFQGEPAQIVWCLLSNGKLLGFTYNKEQEVTGWHRHPIGGNSFVESIATIPAPDGSREELWMIVWRTINGVTHRYVEYMERPWEGADQDGTAGDDQADAFYVDSGLTYSGAPTSSVSAPHLAGATVQTLIDGATHPDITLDGSGNGTLLRTGSKIQLGFGAPARLVPLRIDAGGQDGTSAGKMQRISQLGIRLVDTLGGKIGMYGGTLDDMSLRDPETPMGEPQPITTGVFVTDFPSDWDRNGLIEIRQDQPLPMTIAAIMPIMNTSST